MNREMIEKAFESHMNAMDLGLIEMIDSDFKHDGIHDYREKIRAFRALLFFFMPLIPMGEYRYLEIHSKRYFDKTSLIREVDVFERGYTAFMSAETKEVLSKAKFPLSSRLKRDVRRMRSFRFSNVHMKLKPIPDETLDTFIESRCQMLYQMVLESDVNELIQDEKKIHAKRMLVKKMLYVHRFLNKETDIFCQINEQFESFQWMAKKFHDVCVNLRFVGHYELSDTDLIAQLVSDRLKYQKLAADSFENIKISLSQS